MTKPVFISYARRTSSPGAAALQRMLGSHQAFLDTSELPYGEAIGVDLLDAILSARIVVAFIEPAYLSSSYCLRELQVVLAAYNTLVGINAAAEVKAEALAPVVIALPALGVAALEHLPPLLRETNWPNSANTEALAQLIREQMAAVHVTIGERLERLGVLDSVHTTAVETFRVPPPQAVRAVRRWSLPGEVRPSLGDAFVGRADELWQVHYRLTTLRAGERTPHAAVAIHGGAGSGKTRLVTEYVHRFASHTFTGGIYWVNADLAGRREEQLYGILRSLVPETPSLADLHGSGRLLVDELRAAIRHVPLNQPLLYVVDNIPEPEPDQTVQPLETWCPVLGDVALLVTSRVRYVVPGVFSMALEVLPAAAARTVITHDVGAQRRLSDQQWDAIAAWVGHLPLALEILNAALRTAVITPHELYEQSIEDNPVDTLDETASALRPLVPAGHIRGVTAALAVSYSRLPSIAQRAAGIMALLAPAPIPQAIIDALGADVVPRDIRALLLSRSFIVSLQADGEVALFGRMHRLTAAFLRATLTDHEPAVQQLRMAITGVMQAPDSASPDAAAVATACIPHASEIYSQLASGTASDPAAAVLMGALIVSVLGSLGSIAAARSLAETNAALANHAFGTADARTVRALSDVAVFAHLAGDLERARAVEEHLVRVRRETLGEEHPDTLRSMSRLATMMGTDGQFAAAVELFEQVIAIGRRVLGDEHIHTLGTLSSLAELYRRQGDLARARVIGKKVLEAQRRTLGDDHVATVRSMNNLVAVLRDEGSLAESEALGREVVERRRRRHGPTHINTLRSLRNLAETFQASNKFDEAVELYKRALTAMNRALGPPHPETIRTKRLLASGLRACGEGAAAEELEATLGPGDDASARFGTELA